MLVIYYTGQPCVLRPVPLISITQNAIRNKTGMLGSYYDITLNGTIISDNGSPFYASGMTPFPPISNQASGFIHEYYRPTYEPVSVGSSMASIISKQNLIRELFAIDGQKFELLPAKVDPSTDDYNNSESDDPVIIFYPTVQSISFEEGLYINTCKYTVNLRAEVLLDASHNIISDGLTNSTITNPASNTPFRRYPRVNLETEVTASGFIEDYSENWSIEVDEGRGVTHTPPDSSVAPLPYNHVTSIRTYRLSRSITATGRSIYYSDAQNNVVRKEAWEQAKIYVYRSVLKDTDGNPLNNSTGYEQFPEYGMGPYFGSGFLNISKDIWGGYNHLRTESIDVTAGTFTLNDTWLLSSGTAYEDYRSSFSKGSDSFLHRIGIEGTIKGLSSSHAGARVYGGQNNASPPNFDNYTINSQYTNARNKWNSISNNGQFGPTCYLFKRAQSTTSKALNHIPLSITLGSNEFTGEITYNVEYDSRPSNYVSGTLSENITCSDTYPGDVFAVIPVLGRKEGPVLQYIRGRTEYQRNLNIELIMDKYYTSGNTSKVNQIRQMGLLSKPSLIDPYRADIFTIVNAYSPANETGIRKYFVSPPVETWDPKTGRYSLQINWTYELNT